MRTLPTVHKSGFFTDADGRLRLFWRVFLYTLVQSLIYTFIHAGLQPLLYNKLHVIDIITFLVDGLLHFMLVLLTTSLFWRYIDKRPWRGWSAIGLISPRVGLPSALQGVLLICVIAGVVYSGFAALGWMHILALNLSPIVFLGLLLDMVPRFIDEPLCEEPAFRGYIYRNLNSCLPRWQALLGQVGCFTLFGGFLVGFAFIISAIQGQPFSYPLDVIALYLIALALFGVLLQLCVLLTGNLWMGIGLHMFAIEFPIGVVTPSKGTLLQVEFAPLLRSVEAFHTLVDIPEIGIFVLAIVVLFIWMYRRRPPIDWQRCNPDRDDAEGEAAQSKSLSQRISSFALGYSDPNS